VSLKFGKTEITYSIDGSEGPGVVVEGTLHVASQALLSSDGTPIGFTLHTNLSDAFAESLDGATAYVAVGASDGIPQECQPTGCPPPLWTVTFRLLPLNPGSRSSLLFDATLKTRYAADGTLVNVCVVGQEDCDTNDIP
jgi:hypothetical protein